MRTAPDLKILQGSLHVSCIQFDSDGSSPRLILAGIEVGELITNDLKNLYDQTQGQRSSSWAAANILKDLQGPHISL